MKKAFIKFSAIFISAIMIINCTSGISAEDKPSDFTESYVLMEPDTKTVIREKNGDVPVKMGSFNKLMTVLLAAEAMDRGELDLDMVLSASENANSKQGAQIWLMPGERSTMSELLKGVIIGNANDAACVIAEKIGGSEEKFTELMNARAAELGMKDTLFTECTGYYNDELQHTTAYDAALLLCELSKHEELTEMFVTRLEEIKDGKVQLVTSNPMGHRYKGSVGFKCGTGPSSGYFAAEGACRDGFTLVCAVMDCRDEDRALGLAKELLDTGFGGYTVIPLEIPEEMPDAVRVKNGCDTEAAISARQTGNALISKGSEGDVEARIILPSYVYAPVSRGDKIGELRFYCKDRLLKTVELKAAEDIPKKSILNTLSDMLKYIVQF
ncbi:MAG: D-alanyl-D-alanine carboxypeptidase family protein [Huintestinicola sp.]|uniref:D-alanyl-D-alanine carboxypeptidase family protein n=1 Tax=Huintestinicola sp. TaxID=2981661 RepID=UPI003F11BD3B